MNISPVIIIKNASRTIAQTLESLKEFDEVIVYDTGSVDETMDIARLYPNVKLCKGKFNGFGKSKNKAAQFAKNHWIFSIDADEVVSPQLMNTIRNLRLDNSCVYRLKRYNYYRKRRIRFSGWGLEHVTRIYNKSVTVFNEKLVHEHINISDLTLITLEGELRHFSYSSVSDFVQKRDFYSDLFAKENMYKRKSSPAIAMLHAAYNFFYTFFFRLAFLDGYRGLLIAVLNAHVSFYKYLKLYEANIRNDAKVSLIILLDNDYRDSIICLLESAINQTVAPDEIILASNPLKKDIYELINAYSKKCFIPIHILGQNDMFTLFEPCNSAIEMAKHDYLIFIEGDGILNKNFVHDHLKYSKHGRFLYGADIILSNFLSDKSLQKRLNTLQELSWMKYVITHIPFHFFYKSFKLFYKNNSIPKVNISFFKDELFNINETKAGVIVFDKLKSDLIKKLKHSGLHKRILRFSGVHYRPLNGENNIKPNNKKVLVCLDRLKHPNCGLGQVSLNMGKKLIEVNQTGLEFTFLLPKNGFKEFDNKVDSVKLNPLHYFFAGYMKKFDVCHIIHQLPSYKFGKAKRNLLTIHDLNFLFKKNDNKRQKYLNSLQENIYKSDAITFISEYTRRMCLKHLDIPENKITYVIHNGVVAPLVENDKPSWLDERKFLFSIGQFLEKKNFHVLLPFFKLLPNDVLLIIAGENNTSYGRKMKHLINEQNLSERVIMPGGISDKERNYLYHHCRALLFPSVAEGFGLPVIEAMLCNKPVFCSDRTSLNEIGGEFAFFWKDFDPENMLNVYNKGMGMFEDTEYQETQMKYAQTYTYERNIQKYIKIYNELVELG